MVAETKMCFSRDRHYTNVPLAQGHDGATEKAGQEWMRTEQDWNSWRFLLQAFIQQCSSAEIMID